MEPLEQRLNDDLKKTNLKERLTFQKKYLKESLIWNYVLDGAIGAASGLLASVALSEAYTQNYDAYPGDLRTAIMLTVITLLFRAYNGYNTTERTELIEKLESEIEKI